MDELIDVFALAKGDERYIVLFAEDRRSDALRIVGRWASNPDLSFTWEDAAALSEQIRGAQATPGKSQPPRGSAAWVNRVAGKL